MKILAIEFSTAQRSVALCADGIAVASAVETVEWTTRAFGLIEQALTAAHWEREQIECIAVGLGPGSYTGIRAAIALAQGWQLATDLKLLGISSAQCLAAEAQGRGWFGRLRVVIDAQRNELYLARYEINAQECREIEPLKLASVEEARANLAAGEMIVGPDAKRWFGEGRELYPTAGTLGQLAASRSDFVAGEKLEPIYLRETNFVKAPPPRVLPG